MASDWREEVDFCFHLDVCFIYAINDFVICVLWIFECLKSLYLFIVETYIANDIFWNLEFYEKIDTILKFIRISKLLLENNLCFI